MRKDLGIYVRSTWEANYARYLNWLKAKGVIRDWKFEPRTFEFEHIRRGCRFYTPDFLVVETTGEESYHEVKGYMDQRSATKLARMGRFYPDVKIVLIGKQQYREIANKVGALIPEWETVRGRACRED